MFRQCVLLVALVITQVLCVDKSGFKECAKELKLEPDPKTGAYSNDSDTSCLLKCMYQKLGSIDEKGNYIIENHHDLLQPYLKKCEEKSKSPDPCKKIHEIDECLDEHFEELNKEITKFCAKKTNTEIQEGESLKDYEDYNRACFYSCSLQVMEILDVNGDISYADLIMNGDYIFKGNFDEAIDKCEKENAQADLCLRSMKRINCFMSSFD